MTQYLNAGTFQFSSQRRVWIDFRNGAAVLWSPSYYDEWHRRVGRSITWPAVPKSRTSRVGTRSHYIVDICASPTQGVRMYSTGRLCISRIGS